MDPFFYKIYKNWNILSVWIYRNNDFLRPLTSSPGFTPSIQSRVSMMAAISSMSITPLLSISYKRKAHFSLSSSEALKIVT